MKVKCIGNKYENLKDYEYKFLNKDEFGRFGISNKGEYPLTIGKEYLVMGMFLFQNHLAYLIDCSGLIFTAPCYLFEIVDSRITFLWHFRTVDKKENIYPFVQAIWGYKELCENKQSYEFLIVEQDIEVTQIYYRKKAELATAY